jgi:uncharacterized protein
VTVAFLPDLTAAFAVGLLGSLHCVGMCGPLSSVGCHKTAGPVWFVVGKFISYSILGLLAGTLGAAFTSTGIVARAAALLSLIGGVIMMLAIILHRWARFSSPPVLVSLTRFAAQRGSAAPFFLGIAAAFLPCGLLYAMTARSAATGAPFQAMALMQSFGLGTSPALFGFGAALNVVPKKWARLGTVLGEVVLALTAILLIYRGVSAMLAADAVPPCCH